jgi:hypothetical protein
VVDARFAPARRWIVMLAVSAAVVAGVSGCEPASGDSGITGEVRMVPVDSSEATGTDQSRPLATTLEISEEGLVGSLIGSSVTVESGENGKFSVALEPGTYAIRAAAEQPFTISEPIVVEVEHGQFSIVTIEFESAE